MVEVIQATEASTSIMTIGLNLNVVTLNWRWASEHRLGTEYCAGQHTSEFVDLYSGTASLLIEQMGFWISEDQLRYLSDFGV